MRVDTGGNLLPRARLTPTQPVPSYIDGQILNDHLRGVGDRCAQHLAHLAVFGWGAEIGLVGMLAGEWHDLGKYARAFQHRLKAIADGRPPGRVDHSTAGALLAACVGDSLLNSATDDDHALAVALAFAIAAHHAGLADGRDGADGLVPRLRHLKHLLTEAQTGAAEFGVDAEFQRRCELAVNLPAERLWMGMGPPTDDVDDPDFADPSRAGAFFTRMVLSALVDADRLDAEAWSAAFLKQPPPRPSPPTLGELQAALDSHLANTFASAADAAQTADERAVQIYRAHVLQACREAGQLAPGVFTLTVPTGGGKTLSSLAFALAHALAHKPPFRRIIVAIPYTSIIEQTAATIREGLGDWGDWAVLEHHSNADIGGDDPQANDPSNERRRLAAENWDLPVIVTTNVQLLESLHSSHPGRCRKLHNLARSVIIFDEPQTFPPELCVPIVESLRELTGRYGCSVVLCTATQPAISTSGNTDRVLLGSNGGRQTQPLLHGAREIVPAMAGAPVLPRRVRVEWLGNPADSQPIAIDALIDAIAGEPRILAITHRRADARAVVEALDAKLEHTDTLHLSALMCAAHRRQRVAEIKQRVAVRDGRDLRVVSTQVVEAGVDIDFPVVARALAGLDSLAQAAGRCNRHGREGVEGGRLLLYHAPSKPPGGILHVGYEIARTMFELDPTLDPLADSAITTYFQRLYTQMASGGAFRTLAAQWKFREIARRFVMIPDGGTSIVIPFDADACKLIANTQTPDLPASQLRAALRRLQPYTVSVYATDFRHLLDAGAIAPLMPDPTSTASASTTVDPDQLFVLRRTHATLYDTRFGLVTTGPLTADPASLLR